MGFKRGVFMSLIDRSDDETVMFKCPKDAIDEAFRHCGDNQSVYTDITHYIVSAVMLLNERERNKVNECYACRGKGVDANHLICNGCNGMGTRS